jgi:hypothetical protein
MLMHSGPAKKKELQRSANAQQRAKRIDSGRKDVTVRRSRFTVLKYSRPPAFGGRNEIG